MVRSPIALAAVASATALLAGGCGSSSSGTSSTSASSAAASNSPYSHSGGEAAPASATGSSSSPSGSVVVVASKHNGLGTILAAGPQRRTVYLFEADKGSSSSCTGACSQAWPPVTSTGEPTVAGAAVSADLGTITRSDDTKQITYRGHPLYFFAEDTSSSDAKGEGSTAFGAGWYVLKPSGSKIDNDEGSGGENS